MGSDNWLVVGRIKERDITPHEPTDSPYPVPLLEAFGRSVRPEDIELEEGVDVDRNYYLYSWLGETRGLCPPFKPMSDLEEEALRRALQLLPFSDSFIGSSRDDARSQRFYIGNRHRRILWLDDILSFDLDAVAYIWGLDTDGTHDYVPDPEGKTWRERFGEEGQEFFAQAKVSRDEGMQFFIYGFSG